MEKILTLLKKAEELGWVRNTGDSYFIVVFCLSPYEEGEEIGMTYISLRLNIWLRDSRFALSVFPVMKDGKFHFSVTNNFKDMRIMDGTFLHKHPHQAVNEGVDHLLEFLITLKENNQ